MDCLTPVGMGDADHGGHHDLRVLRKRRFHFHGINIEASADNHVLLPVDNKKIAVLIQVTQVS